ncbi:MAG: JAB-like toxin 1 domain-containing protein, partial [Bacteroidales bacterium]|jgi:hypothetical protein|nr:JAB-like toxin 1 domain-containing protein [Bacteroidales bacterium]
VNPDGYTVDDDGNVERVDDTGGDDYDVLYKKSDYWIAQQKTRQTGETNEYGNPEPEKQLKVYDTSILPSLEKTDTKFRQEDYWNTTIVNNKYNPNTKEWTKTYEVPMLQGHYCITKNSYEAKKVFDFLASNSKVEWASKGSVNGKWFIGTLHVDGQAPDAKLLTGYTKENTPVFTVMVDFGVMQIFYDAHSHPLNSEEIDFKPSPTDIYRKNRLREENPNIQFWLFMPQNPKTKWINYGNY